MGLDKGDDFIKEKSEEKKKMEKKGRVRRKSEKNKTMCINTLK